MKRNMLFKIPRATLLGLGLLQSYHQLFKEMKSEMDFLFWIIVAVVFVFLFIIDVFEFKFSIEGQIYYQVVVVLLNFFFLAIIIYCNIDSLARISLYLFFYLITFLIGQIKLTEGETPATT